MKLKNMIPFGVWSRPIQPPFFTLESLAQIPCLVLLGEPGIGKSDEIEKAFVSFQPPNINGVKLPYPDGPVDSFRGIFTHDIFNHTPEQPWWPMILVGLEPTTY